MALPLVKSLQDCADYHQTVEPFIPQLYALPQRLLDTAGSPASLRQLYIETNPLVSGFAISIALGFVFLIVSEINRNYSQVDRMWSLLPNLYIIHFAVWANVAGLPTNRLNLIAAFSSIWSVSHRQQSEGLALISEATRSVSHTTTGVVEATKSARRTTDGV
jgi:hypothetical protein